jgi:SPP1 family predicted phage head-tail adaptor
MIVAKKIFERYNRVSCIGDMRERVKLHERSMQAPVFDSTDVSENFEGTKVVWANVITVTGQTFFSEANVDVSLTHVIIIRYDNAVSSETWIELENKNLRIVSVEDLDMRHEFMKLRCTSRGDKTLGAAQG